MIKVRAYQKENFDQVCYVMDEGRKQELASENLLETFVPLKDAPYLKYFLSCTIKVAVDDQKIVGFVGYARHRLEFIYVDPNYQGQGIGTKLMQVALEDLNKPVTLSVFTNNLTAKNLYKKFGFKVVETVTEKWSQEVPQVFSEDTMELR